MNTTYDSKKLFYQARIEYDSILDDIENLGLLIKIYAFPEFNTDLAKKEFDNILQCILLKMAISDGEFHPLEADFIKNITNNGCLLEKINSHFNSTYTWDNIIEENLSKLNEIADFTERISEDEAEDFCLHFSSLNSIVEKNLIEEINDKLTIIIDSMANIDGHADPEEQEAFNSTYGKLILQRWNNIKEQANEFDSSKVLKKLPTKELDLELEQNSVLKTSERQKKDL